MATPSSSAPAIAHGLEGIVLTETRLSRVDGAAGQLWIGGFRLEDLAPHARFEETIFLLLHDRLPTREEEEKLRADLARDRALPPRTLEILREAAQTGLDPMDALRIGVSTLGLERPELIAGELRRQSPAERRGRTLRFIAAIPTLAASYQRLLDGQEPLAPRADLRHAAHYLYLLRGAEPQEAAVRALETYLSTAVDHGMNASTFTARVIASTRSDLGSALTGALGALKGPLHGGAPGPALDMVFELQAAAKATGRPLSLVAADRVRDRVERGERIMGFGHRVYQVRDPRADVLGAAVEKLFPEPGENPLYDDARSVEQVVLRVLAELKPGRRVQTNVEFYTALLLHGLGLPSALFAPTFAVARVVGWCSHVLEQVEEDRLIRPRVAYCGEVGRRFVPSELRAGA